MISELLSVGPDNCTSAKDLCAILNLSPRELTQRIMIERRQGIPICANCNGHNPGYYLAEDRETLDAYCRILYRRLGEIAKTYRALKGCIMPDRSGPE